MNVDEIKAYCCTFAGVNEASVGEPSNILAYTIGDKKFAYFKTSEPEQWRFSLRVTPDRFLELTDQPGIKPARYMQRFHWVTIVNVDDINSNYIKELITWSYNKALSRLSKKVQDSFCQL